MNVSERVRNKSSLVKYLKLIMHLKNIGTKGSDA